MPRNHRIALALLLPIAWTAAAVRAAEADEQAIIELTPFQVSSERDVGYVANNTLAGSRLRTNLADVANAISVFTPEFMADLNAFGEAELMRYSAAAVPERTDQTAVVQGISIDTGGFQFRIRGQVASRSRNYFGSSIVPDTFNSERFEEARGPNAILFGLGGAGGILNTTTKQAKLGRDFTQLGITFANDGFRRATLDRNQRLTERLALRINAVDQETDGWQRHQFSENRRLALAATWRPLQRTTVRFDAEFGKVRNSLMRIYAPFDNVSQWKLSGSPLVASGTGAANAPLGIAKRAVAQRVTFIGNDGSFHNFQQTVFSQPMASRVNSVFLPGDWEAVDSAVPYPAKASFSGPGGISEFTQRSLGVTVESEPLRNLFLEFAAVHDLRDHDVYDTTHEVFRILGEPGQTFRDGAVNPYAGLYYVDSRWVLRHERNSGERFRATASYSLDLGRAGRHTFAGLASRDYTGNPRYVSHLVLAGAPYNPQPQVVANQIWTRQYIENPADPAQWAAPDFRRIPTSFSVVMDPGVAPRTFQTEWANAELNDQWRHTDSQLVSLQSAFLSDRLIATVGWRNTRQTAFARPTNGANAGAPMMFTGDALSDTSDFERLSYGIVAKPRKWLSLYYNYSENAQIPGTTQTLIPDKSPFPLNSGEGEDYGVMLSLLDGRIFVRAGYFQTTSVDQNKAYGVNNVSIRNDRIMDAMLAAGLITPDKVIRFEGGDFDLADLETKGYEINVTANVTPSWRVLFNLSHSESVETNLLKRSRPAAALVVPLWRNPAAQSLVTTAGVTVAREILNYESWLASTTAVENEGTIGHRELEMRGFTRYDFRSGLLKGVFVGGGLSYGSAPVIGRSTDGVLHKAEARREADLLFGYKTRLPAAFGRAGVEIQFNANNLLQQSPYTLLRRDPDGQYYRAMINAPTSYMLSVRLNF